MPRRLKHFQQGSWPSRLPLSTTLRTMYLKLHLHGRLLAANIGILPFFFLKSIKKETRAIEEELKDKMPILTAKSQRRRGEGGLASHWHAEYAKYPVFITFETSFYSKSKNSPPIVIGNKNVTALTLDLKKNRSQNSIPTQAKTFFSFLGLHVISGKKTFQFQMFQFRFIPPRQPLPPSPRCKFLATSLAKSRPCECNLRVIPSTS